MNMLMSCRLIGRRELTATMPYQYTAMNISLIAFLLLLSAMLSVAEDERGRCPLMIMIPSGDG